MSTTRSVDLIGVLRACYGVVVESISQRELRNNSAAVIRGLERGESYRLTNRGVAVGVLLPIGATRPEDHLVRVGSQNMDFTPAVAALESTGEILAEFRSDR